MLVSLLVWSPIKRLQVFRALLPMSKKFLLFSWYKSCKTGNKPRSKSKHQSANDGGDTPSSPIPVLFVLSTLTALVVVGWNVLSWLEKLGFAKSAPCMAYPEYGSLSIEPRQWCPISGPSFSSRNHAAFLVLSYECHDLEARGSKMEALWFVSHDLFESLEHDEVLNTHVPATEIAGKNESFWTGSPISAANVDHKPSMPSLIQSQCWAWLHMSRSKRTIYHLDQV